MSAHEKPISYQPARPTYPATTAAWKKVFVISRRRWSITQRHTIFRLLPAPFGAMIGNPTNGAHLQPATAGRTTVEAWLRCQNLIAVRQNQKPMVSTHYQKNWSHN